MQIRGGCERGLILPRDDRGSILSTIIVDAACQCLVVVKLFARTNLDCLGCCQGLASGNLTVTSRAQNSFVAISDSRIQEAILFLISSNRIGGLLSLIQEDEGILLSHHKTARISQSHP